MKRIINILLAAILTMAAGRITYNDHTEVWYDLPMDRVVKRAQNMGIPCEYWVRESDGVKMFGPWVIVAGHKSKTRYTLSTHRWEKESYSTNIQLTIRICMT